MKTIPNIVYGFPPVGLDRYYFAPYEVAYMHHSVFSKTSNNRMDQFFHEHVLRGIIKPGSVRSGFVFSNLEMGTKAFNVDLFGEDNEIWDFTFLIPVQDLKVDHYDVDWSNMYTKHDKVTINNSEILRNTLEDMPCCTTGEDVTQMADPGNTRKGFVFTNLDEGTKSFAVDLAGEDGQARTFTFFIPVPGLKFDHAQVDFQGLYSAEVLINFENEADFIQYLENLPCCTMNKKGTNTGDPLNLIIIGDSEDVFHSFIRTGWDETETITASSTWKTGLSFIFGGRYRYSPVSAQYVFNRSQDIALQRARTTIHERNHLRLWLTPVQFKGKLVWVGQISRDIGVRFDKRTIVTHRIDPDVDETRNFLTQDLLYSQGLSKFAFTGGVGSASMESPRHNLGRDPYFTDGLRCVMWVSDDPVAFDEVDFIEWALPSE